MATTVIFMKESTNGNYIMVAPNMQNCEFQIGSNHIIEGNKYIPYGFKRTATNISIGDLSKDKYDARKDAQKKAFENVMSQMTNKAKIFEMDFAYILIQIYNDYACDKTCWKLEIDYQFMIPNRSQSEM